MNDAIRKATPHDIDFLAAADWQVGLDEELEIMPPLAQLTPAQRADHWEKIGRFVTDVDKSAWIAVAEPTGARAGMILCRWRSYRQEDFSSPSSLIFRLLDADIFPADGAFCEIFQLWVHPDYRRRGIATRLKIHLEATCQARGVTMIYTHTLARNHHVLALNRRLGYREVRRGPIWDEQQRVSLVKYLPPAAAR